MTGTQHSPATGSAQYGGRGGVEHPGWLGWVLFAGVMMILLGSFQAIAGLVALLDDEFYLVGKSGLVVSVDFTTWGWVHLLLGIVALLAGIGAMVGQTWARAVGIVLAVLSAIANIAFLPAYPIWSTIIIAVDVVIIYALAVHGGEARTSR